MDQPVMRRVIHTRDLASMLLPWSSPPSDKQTTSFAAPWYPRRECLLILRLLLLLSPSKLNCFDVPTLVGVSMTESRTPCASRGKVHLSAKLPAACLLSSSMVVCDNSFPQFSHGGRGCTSIRRLTSPDRSGSWMPSARHSAKASWVAQLTRKARCVRT